MGLFDFLRQPDINQGIRDYSAASNAVLLDVRTPREYREGMSRAAGIFHCSLLIRLRVSSRIKALPSLSTAIPAAGAVRQSAGL